MLRSFLVIVVCAGLALSACAPETKRAQTDPRLDPLFTELRAAPDAASAQVIEHKIWSIWAQSGSATVDILLERAEAAEAAGDVRLARAFLDQAVQILPEYAEAYNRRAVLAFDAHDRAAALQDLEEALVREPRHFGALAALGMIYESMGHKKAALEAYEAALAVDPFFEQARQGAKRLKSAIEGQET